MITKSMTYRIPTSGRAAVECSDDKTFGIERRGDLPAIVMGTIIDRLHDYETLGELEYLQKLVDKDKNAKAQRIAMNSIYGKMQASMFYIDTDTVTADDVLPGGSMWPKVNPNLKKTNPALPEIDRVIFNAPATIVFWKDDTKTVVKANNGEPYDPEKGLAMAMVKKVSGNKGNYYNTIRKELDKNPYDNSEVCHVKDYANMYHCLKQCEVNVRNSYANLVGVLNNKKATKADLIEAIELSVGRLGELLDEGGPLD